MDEIETAPARFFAIEPRIGRLRYLAYSIGIFLLVLIPLAIGMALSAVHLTGLSAPLLALVYLFMLVMNIIFTVRRLHDMNASGWWTLLSIVPVANFVFALVLLFTPGTDGTNRFGAPPPANSTWVVVGAWCYLLVPISGIAAAIAIPAYQDYVTRTQLFQSVSTIQSLEAQTANYHQVNGKWPASLQDIGTSQPADQGVIEAIEFDNNGTIHALFRGSVWVRGKSLSMSPVTDANGETTWNCRTDLPRRFLPLSLRDSCAVAASQ